MWQQSGFMQSGADVGSAIEKLEHLLGVVTNKFGAISDDGLVLKPMPDKWSAKELLGHLIDSAINNLKRFTEIQFLPSPYKIQAYQQIELVRVNNYQHLPIEHVLNLCNALNQQIIFVVKNMDDNKYEYPVYPQYESGEIQTLGWIICDYVAHIEHHFKQIVAQTS